MSPVMASFQAGTALGPAIGGLAVTHLGIANSYFAVGGMISALALGNHFMLRESKPSSVVNTSVVNTSVVNTSVVNTSVVNTSVVTVPIATASPSPVLHQTHMHAHTHTHAGTPGRQSSFALAMSSWSKLVQQKPMRDVVLAKTV